MTVSSVVSRLGQPQGVTDVAPDVVALISHATQERLHRLLVKLTVLAGHRKAALKVPQWWSFISFFWRTEPNCGSLRRT